MTNNPMDRALVRITEAAVYLGVSKRTLTKMVKCKVLTTVRLSRGGQRYFRTSELRAVGMGKS